MISVDRFMKMKNDIYCLLVLQNKNLVVCSKGQIEIINLQTKTIEETIPTDDKKVWCITEYQSEYLIYSLFDENIYIWNLLEHKFCYTFEAHKKKVMHLIPLTKEYICSCSDDTTIKIWDFQNKKEILTLSGHHECVFSVLLLKNTNFIVSLSTEQKVIIWDWKNKQRLLTYDDIPHCRETSLVEFKNFIIIGGEGCIYLIDTNSFSKKVDRPIEKITISGGKPSMVKTICNFSDDSILIFYDKSLFLANTKEPKKLITKGQREYEMEKIVVLDENIVFFNVTRKLYKVEIKSTRE